MHTSMIHTRKPLAIVAAVFLFTLPDARANPTDRGDGTIYDSALQSVWTQDGNLFKTLAQTTPGLVGEVIAAVGGQVTDSNGSYFLNGTEFDTATGELDWYGAQAWTAFLNQIRYGGYSNWTLPAVVPVGDGLFNTEFSNDGSTDVGYNGASTKSQWGHLYYASLGNLGYYGSDGAGQADFGLRNAGPFVNLQTGVYWTAAELNGSEAFYFATLDGLQQTFDKTQRYSVINIAAVPLPAAVWLFGSALGLAGLAGSSRRACVTRTS